MLICGTYNDCLFIVTIILDSWMICKSFFKLKLQCCNLKFIAKFLLTHTSLVYYRQVNFFKTPAFIQTALQRALSASRKIRNTSQRGYKINSQILPCTENT